MPCLTQTTYITPQTLDFGAAGQDVEFLQQLLNHHLPYTLLVDEIFGEYTEDAVKDFQGYHDLTQDGVVGPETWHELGIYIAV